MTDVLEALKLVWYKSENVMDTEIDRIQIARFSWKRIVIARLYITARILTIFLACFDVISLLGFSVRCSSRRSLFWLDII